MEIEKQILAQSAPVAVDRSEVRTWLEQEETRMHRSSVLKFAGTVLLLGCLLGFIVQRLESETQRVKQLVGNVPPSHILMIQEITEELCGEAPGEYWNNQISLIQTPNSLANL